MCRWQWQRDLRGVLSSVAATLGSWVQISAVQTFWQAQHTSDYVYVGAYRGADKSLARRTSLCILFDGENISFDAPWSRVLLEKLTGSAASQEIPRIFGTRRFITVLTSARHLSLSWANSIQSLQPPPTSWRSILILSSHLRLGLPNGLFPSGFPTRTEWRRSEAKVAE